MRHWILSWAAAVGLFFAPATGEAAEDSAKKEAQHFHLTMPHTPQQCLAALDHMSANDKKLFEKTEWGCRYGDHTGYVTITAADEQAALAMVPEPERANAKAQKVGKFTQKDLEEIHKKKAAAK